MDDNPTFVKWLSEQVAAIQLQKSTLVREKNRLELLRQEILDHTGLTDMRQTAETYLAKFTELTGVQKRNFIEKMVESIIVKSDNTIEIRFLGRPDVSGVNERKKSLYYEGNGSPGLAVY